MRIYGLYAGEFNKEGTVVRGRSARLCGEHDPRDERYRQERFLLHRAVSPISTHSLASFFQRVAAAYCPLSLSRPPEDLIVTPAPPTVTWPKPY